ncbi:MAG: GAF domain-containing protein, partial [Phycisphaerae bacterium]
MARWPGQKLLVADAAKTPSQHASVTSAQAIARLRAALDPPQRRLTTLRAARRPRRHPAANRPASLEQLLTVAGSLNCLNRRQLIDLCVNDLPAALGLQLASFYQYDPKGRSLVLAQHNHGYPINDIVDVRRCPTQVMAWAARKRKPWLAEDLREQPPVRNGVVERPFADRYSTASCVIIPLQSRGRLVGVLNLADPLDDRPLRLKQIRPAVEAVA